MGQKLLVQSALSDPVLFCACAQQRDEYDVILTKEGIPVDFSRRRAIAFDWPRAPRLIQR
jgi:hypothetical protein